MQIIEWSSIPETLIVLSQHMEQRDGCKNLTGHSKIMVNGEHGTEKILKLQDSKLTTMDLTFSLSEVLDIWHHNGLQSMARPSSPTGFTISNKCDQPN